jgi:hypothetical protein
VTSLTKSPLASVGAGLVAAVAGTAAMDLVSYMNFRRGGGKDRFLRWETGADVTSWGQVSAPGQVGKRIVEGLVQCDLPDGRARLTNNTVHWATGVAWGAVFGVVAGGATRPKRWWGAILGSAAWATSYAVLPATGLYKPITEYDAKTLGNDLGAHLAYGLATGVAFTALR